MKNILTIVMLFALLIGLTSCSKHEEQPIKTNTHEKFWNSSGEEMVKVQGYDSNGKLIEYFMLYSLFNSLHSQGGYGAVNNYYTQHRASYDRDYKYNSRKYSRAYNPQRKQSAINTVKKSNYNKINLKKSTPLQTKTVKPTYKTSYVSSIKTYKPSTIYKRPSISSYKSSSKLSFKSSRSKK